MSARHASHRSHTHDDVWPVSGSKDDDAVELFDAIHLGQETEQDTIAARATALV